MRKKKTVKKSFSSKKQLSKKTGLIKKAEALRKKTTKKVKTSKIAAKTLIRKNKNGDLKPKKTVKTKKQFALSKSTKEKKHSKLIKPKSFSKKKTNKVTLFEELIIEAKTDSTVHEQSRIEESKFDLGIPENAKAMPEHELPSSYNKDQAVILTVSPHFVFAYWEVTNNSMHEAVSKIGYNTKLTLRFYDITLSSNPDHSPHWDIEVFDRLGNWYLKLDYPEQKLTLDIGLKNEFGNFYPLTRSNTIKLPRTTLADPGPLKWMIVTDLGDKITTDIEDYTDADLELLRKILGPHFFDLLIKGKFSTLEGPNLEAVFQEISSFRLRQDSSSSPTMWSNH